MDPKELNRKTYSSKSKHHSKQQKEALEHFTESLGQQAIEELSDFYNELNNQRFMTPEEKAESNAKIQEVRTKVNDMCRHEMKQSKNHFAQDKTFLRYVDQLKMNEETHEQLNEFLLELQKRKTMDKKELKQSKMKYTVVEQQLTRKYYKFREVDLPHQQDYKKIDNNVDNDL